MNIAKVTIDVSNVDNVSKCIAYPKEICEITLELEYNYILEYLNNADDFLELPEMEIVNVVVTNISPGNWQPHVKQDKKLIAWMEKYIEDYENQLEVACFEHYEKQSILLSEIYDLLK